jgi:hypothetical protein
MLMKKWLIFLAIVALIFGAYAAAGFYGVPWLLRTNLQKFVSTHYGRQVTVGDIHFNPFKFTLEIRSFSLPDADRQPMLSFGRLFVHLDVKSVWRRAPSFRDIVLENPYARVLVRRDGDLNFNDLTKPFPPSPAPKQKEQAPMHLYIDRLSVQGGQTLFEDRSRPAPFRADLKPIHFELRDFSTVARRTGNAYQLAATSDEGERFNWSGTLGVNPLASRGHFQVTDLRGRSVWNYIRESVGFQVASGIINLAGDYDFSAAASPPRLNITVPEATLTDVSLRPLAKDEHYVDLSRIEIHGTSVDLAKQSVKIDKVHLAGGEVHAWRDPSGAINLQELTAAPGAPAGTTDEDDKAAPPAPAAAAASAPKEAKAASHPWSIAIPDISVEGLNVSAEDRTVDPVVEVAVNPLNVHVTGYTSAPDAQLHIDTDATVNKSAKIRANTTLTPESGAITAHTEVSGLDLTLVQPYLSQQTSMTLLSGLLATKLDIKRAADGAVAVAGETEITKMRTIDNGLRKNLVKWDSLRASGIDYKSQPAKLRINEMVARGAYARVILESNQTLNITEAMQPPHAGAAPAGPPTSEPAPEQATAKADTKSTDEAAKAEAPAEGDKTAKADAGANPSSREAQRAASTPESSESTPDAPVPVASTKPLGAPRQTGAPATSSNNNDSGSDAKRQAMAKKSRTEEGKGADHGKAAPQDSQQAEASMPVSIGTVRFIDSSAHFADYWIKPNYAVSIDSLNGTVSGLSSDPKSRAKVDLKGKVDRYAPVSIEGEMNLFSVTAYTDVKMTFKGVEMSSVTPYSGRFAGYKIEKGKVSADITYHVDQRKLSADHKITIDRLQLGEKVDSPEAVHLPLKLAVALLKDKNGVINLGLPVTGSLDDPKFRVGPIIWKLVVGLLTKVAEAPFTLIGKMFGGNGEMDSYIDFKAGSATLEPSAQQKLGTLVKAMKEKQGLEVDVPMAYAADIDRPVLAREALDAKLQDLQRQDAEKAAQEDKKRHKHNKPQEAAGGESPPLNPAERYGLLLTAYRQELGPDAPLPDSAAAIEGAKKKKKGDAEEMAQASKDLEGAITQHMQVGDADLEKLAKQRGQAIQDALLGGGEIDQARVFLINAKGKPQGTDSVRVELSLK